MKKKILLAIVLATAACTGAFAQVNKINGAGRMMLNDFYAEASKARSAAADAPEVSVIVNINDGYTTADLRDAGYEVTIDLVDVAMVKLPISEVEALAEMEAVKAVDFGTKAQSYMDKGRALTGVDQIHAGEVDGLAGMSYTGKGVAVGLYDTGLDPNHAAFRNADGTSRVKAIYEQRRENANNRQITDPAEIALYTTEDPGEYHGTHVLGIMAGTKGVQGKYATSATSGPVAGEIPYYGSAYNADIIVSCGDFNSEPILSGVANVVSKGKELGLPTVVNMSLGHNTGAHDPNSTNCKFLDRLGEQAIICISAGNEGTSNMAVKQKFADKPTSMKTMKTFIVPENSPSKSIYGTAEFWCSTEDAMEATLICYDRTSGQIVDSHVVPMSSNSLWQISKTKFAEQFTSSSSIRYISGVDAATGRYNVYLEVHLVPTGNPTYLFGVNITGKAGSTCFGYINGYYLDSSYDTPTFSKENVTGYLNGTPNGSINDFACGKNVVAVGAYVSRLNAPYVGGGNYPGGGTEGDIASFSSYGETADGRKLPIVCAPGAQVVSAISTYYTRNLSSFSADRTNATCNLFGRDSYYYPAQGTSMASPFAAGIIALWLEAYPHMTIAEVQDIIATTSIKDKYVNSSAGDNPKRWGAGKIDAIAGLKEAIKRNASVNSVLADANEKNLIIEPTGDKTYSVCMVGAQNIKVSVYSTAGALVAGASAMGDTANLDASALASGIYVLKVETPNSNISRKYAVK